MSMYVNVYVSYFFTIKLWKILLVMSFLGDKAL